MADPVLLFRYSALTFNGHRIHYDRDYVTKVEGYPGLVFHGPLQAAFIVEFAAKLHGGTAPKKFSYRGLQPLFEGSEFSDQRQRHRRRHGTVDREFGRPADDEGHRDVVSFIAVIASERSRSRRCSSEAIASSRSLSWIASSLSLLAMTEMILRSYAIVPQAYQDRQQVRHRQARDASICCARSASKKCSAIPARPNCRS